MQYRYPKSDHETALDEIFGEKANVNYSGEPFPVAIMGFVNRSGSNYTAELLKSTGKFAGFHEALNNTHMARKQPAYEVDSFQDYLMKCREEDLGAKPDRIWGVKAGWGQLAMLNRTGAIPKLMKPTLILVRRRDMVAQAVSFAIAETTGQWTSKGKEQIPRDKVPYNGQRILASLRNCAIAYSKLAEVALFMNCPVHEIVYEDILEGPVVSIAHLTKDMLGTELAPMQSSVRIMKQGDKLNDEFKARFLAELAKTEWTPQRVDAPGVPATD